MSDHTDADSLTTDAVPGESLPGNSNSFSLTEGVSFQKNCSGFAEPKGNLEKPVNRNSPVSHRMFPKLDDIRIPRHEYPPELREGQYDGVLIYAEADQKACLQLKDLIEQYIVLEDGKKPRICVLDRNDNLQFLGGRFAHMAEAIERSTFMFIFMTKSLVDDTWADMMKDECLMEAINNPLKRWCVVPLYPKKKVDLVREGFKMPFGFAALKGVDISNMLNGLSLGEVDGDQLTIDNFDKFFLRNMRSMLSSHLLLKKERERKDEELIRKWLREEKEQRYRKEIDKYYEEEQERERNEKLRQQMIDRHMAAQAEPLPPHPYTPDSTLIGNAGRVTRPIMNPGFSQSQPHISGDTHVHYNFYGSGPVHLPPAQQLTYNLSNVSRVQIGTGHTMVENSPTDQHTDESDDRAAVEVHETDDDPELVDIVEIPEHKSLSYLRDEQDDGVYHKHNDACEHSASVNPDNACINPLIKKEPVEREAPIYPGDQPSGIISMHDSHRHFAPRADSVDRVQSLPGSEQHLSATQNPVAPPAGEKKDPRPVAMVSPLVSPSTDQSVQFRSESGNETHVTSSSMPQFHDDVSDLSISDLPRSYSEAMTYPRQHCIADDRLQGQMRSNVDDTSCGNQQFLNLDEEQTNLKQTVSAEPCLNTVQWPDEAMPSQLTSNTNPIPLSHDALEPQLPNSTSPTQLPNDISSLQLPSNMSTPKLPQVASATRLPNATAPQLPQHSLQPQLANDASLQHPNDASPSQQPHPASSPQMLCDASPPRESPVPSTPNVAMGKVSLTDDSILSEGQTQSVVSQPASAASESNCACSLISSDTNFDHFSCESVEGAGFVLSESVGNNCDDFEILTHSNSDDEQLKCQTQSRLQFQSELCENPSTVEPGIDPLEMPIDLMMNNEKRQLDMRRTYTAPGDLQMSSRTNSPMLRNTDRNNSKKMKTNCPVQ